MNSKFTVDDCIVLDLPKIPEPRGNLTFIESNNHVPFDIKRVYYLYDVPGGTVRGGHAHKELQQLLIALSGSFDITLDDGIQQTKITLNRPSFGLKICPMIWRELHNFSSGAVCLVLASLPYCESDYFRNYDEFLAARAE
jgi:hypothetical protein